jgi:molybdenum cofactor synthesis domain-containing protein
MPKEGIFCRVVKHGSISPGEHFEYVPKVFRVKVITLSDRASKGVYEDRSGPRVTELLEQEFDTLNWKADIKNLVIPDSAENLKDLLLKFRADAIDFVITTGGTGIGPRDITPEVTRELVDKEIPGIMDMIRVKYGAEKPGALLARGLAGLMDRTFVFNLPGSVKAVNEYIPEISQHFRHLVLMLHGIDQH